MASDSPLKCALLARSVLALGGDAAEQREFLQSLLTNDVAKAAPDTLIYAALLTPQGKFLSDMFVMRDAAGDYRLDLPAPLAGDVLKRLTMYRLRRPVTLAPADIGVHAVWGGEPPPGALRDPRHPALGWRIYGPATEGAEMADYGAHRLALGVPEAPVDLVPNDTFILEAGFEALGGVDFTKGCYVGQEIVARMKHKTTLRKGYRTVSLDGSAEPGSEIVTEEGRNAGTLYSNGDGVGIALLRLDRADGPLRVKDGCAIRLPA